MPTFFVLGDGGDNGGAALQGFLAVLALVGIVVLGTADQAEVVFVATFFLLGEKFAVGA